MKKILFIAVLFVACKPSTIDQRVKNQTNSTEDQSSIKQPILVNIRKLLLKTPVEVSKVLGKPSKITKSTDCGVTSLKHCIEMQYHGGNITVQYTKYKLACWFEFDNLQGYKMVNLPEIFGLENSPPTTTEFNYVWFANFSGINKISFIYKKAERLAKAVHLISPAFAGSPALRDRIGLRRPRRDRLADLR